LRKIKTKINQLRESGQHTKDDILETLKTFLAPFDCIEVEAILFSNNFSVRYNKNLHVSEQDLVVYRHVWFSYNQKHDYIILHFQMVSKTHTLQFPIAFPWGLLWACIKRLYGKKPRYTSCYDDL